MVKIEIDVLCTDNWFLLDNEKGNIIMDFCNHYNGKEVILSLARKRSSRTKKANDFYWGAIVKGYEREWPDLSRSSIHDILGETFRKFRRSPEEIERLIDLYKKNNLPWDESREWYIKGSSEMNSYDFWEYCEKCIIQLIDIGGYIDNVALESYNELKDSFKDKK